MKKIEKNTLYLWHTRVFMLLFHIGALCAIFYFSWQALAVGFSIWFLANCPGVGVCFHRLLTHRGYQTPKYVEYFLTVLGCLALQGSPVRWVAIHRAHHKYTEQPGKDPHTPKEGMAWAQWLWMLYPNPSLDNELIEKFAPDLEKDKFHKLAHKFWWVPSVMVGVILLYVGWPDPSLFLWGSFAQVAFGWEVTWMVNSVTHRWGSRRFHTADDSTNNWWVAWLTFGEGWHNNHHQYPTSARHGLAWYEIDMNYWVIRALVRFGLAKNVKIADLVE